MAGVNGREYLMWVATAAPTTADDSSDAAYAALGELTTYSIGRSRAALDASSKDDGINSTFVSGRLNQTVTGTVRYDETADTGQDKVQDSLEGTVSDIWFLCSTDVTNDEEFYGKGLVTQWNMTFPDEGVCEVQFAIQVTGALTRQIIS